MTSFTVLTFAPKPPRAFRPNSEEPIATRRRFKPDALHGAILVELTGSLSTQTFGDPHNMRPQAVKSEFLWAQAAPSGGQTMMPTAAFAAGAGGRRIGAILALPFVWCQRARFRAKLREDLRDNADFLNDIGIRVHEAQAEASRFFWERTLLKHR
jgi:uncharacterized protein YjiS (DUF1127 family)